MDQPPFKKRWLMERDDDIKSMEVDPPDSDRHPTEVDPPREDKLMEVYLPPSGHTSHHPTLSGWPGRDHAPNTVAGAPGSIHLHPNGYLSVGTDPPVL